jgi:hypothetical protein
MLSPRMILLSIATSPNSFIRIAVRSGGSLRMRRSSVVLPLPSDPVMSAMGVFNGIGSYRSSDRAA